MPIVKCAYCGKEIEVASYQIEMSKNNFCNKQCQGKYNRGRKRSIAKDIKVYCAYCGKGKYVKSYKYNKNQNYFCDRYCQGKYKTANAPSNVEVELICENCGKRFKRKKKHISKKFEKKFCNRQCAAEYKKKRVIVKCAWCGSDIEKNICHLDRSEKYFCNDKCDGKWKSKHWVGENNHNYSKVIATCYYCGKTFKRKKSQVDKNEKQFCNKKCFNKYLNTPEGREGMRQAVLKTLSTYPRRTQPEIETANALKELGVWFGEQEVINERFCVDFLLDEKLIIEVMGDYFHANPEIYGDKQGLKPLNDMQKRNILNDYRKRQYLKKCGYKILDLWESEINAGKTQEKILGFILAS
jgi:very-short-patch-repair endonuclease